MDIRFTGRDLTVSQKMIEYFEKRFEKIKHYFKKISVVDVIIKLETKNSKVVEVKFSADKHNFFTEEKGESIYEAIDLAAESIEKQARRFNDRTRSHRQKKVWEAEYDSISEGDIYKVLESYPKPMTEIEALMQCEMSNLKFLMFNNGDAGSLSVVFRRDDNKYAIFYEKKSKIRILDLADSDFDKMESNDLRTRSERDFKLSRLLPAEAVRNMKDYNSDFYIFINSEDNEVNIVYLVDKNSIALVRPSRG